MAEETEQLVMAEASFESEHQLSLEDVEPIQNEGGYPLLVFEVNGNKVDKNFICNICNLVFREPMQRECGHRFCKICLEKTDAKTTCHNCLEETSDEGAHFPTVSILNSDVNCSPDYFLRKELDRLPAQCINPECIWKGKFKEYKQHCLKCDWLPLECSRCHMKDIPLCMLENHRKDTCAETIPCPLDCGSQIPQRMLPDHIQQDLCGHLLQLKSLISGERNPGESHYPVEFKQKLNKIDKIIGVFQSDMIKFTQLLVNEIKEREALAIKVSKMTPDCYNGIFIWRVDDFEKRRQDAVNGTCTSIYSTPFYTSNFGYKMCLRLYLNGDGIGKGKAISLFIVVMQGQYDAVLSWPFKQKVTLMMLDQVESKHVIDTFRPDSKSSSFQRPEHKMNIASGCPLFFPISQLNISNNYIKNNTAFFKVIVDLTGLEKMPVNFMPT